MKTYNNFINENKYWVFKNSKDGRISKLPCNRYTEEQAIEFMKKEPSFDSYEKPYMEEDKPTKIEPVKHSDFVVWLQENDYPDATDLNLEELFDVNELEYLHNKYTETL